MSFQARAALRETAQDFAVVAAFGFWALVIGFVPFAAFRVLIA
jgi:hypothetical protein